MTEFETQVAEALLPIFRAAILANEYEDSRGPTPDRVLLRLAPRVAAALEEALPPIANANFETRERRRRVALASLRGVVRAPAETPP